MRASLPATLLLSILLTACTATRDVSASRRIAQNTILKVHPGLLGQTVPSELQEPAAAKATANAGSPAPAPVPAAPIVPPVIYFDHNSIDLRAEFDSALQTHARHLAANPNAQLRIEGNADERGADGYNQQLGQKRAEAVRQALIANGAPDKQLSVKSHGALQPKKKGHDEESWAENRRVELIYEKE